MNEWICDDTYDFDREHERIKNMTEDEFNAYLQELKEKDNK